MVRATPGGGGPTGTAVSTGVRSTQALEPRTTSDAGTASTSQAVTMSPTLTAGQMAAIQQATSSVGASAAGMSDYGITSGIVAQLQQSGLFTAQEIADVGAAFINPNTGTFSFAATSGQEASWVQQIEGPILSDLNLAALPIVPPDNTTGSGGGLTPIAPPPGTGNPGDPPVVPPGSTGGTGGTGGGSSSTTTGAGLTNLPNSLLTLLTTLLQGTGGGSGSGSSGSSGVAPAVGDEPGTNTPISSLPALTPIGTPTSTTSAGSPEVILGVVAAAAAGVGFWLYERHKKKTAPKPTIKPAAAAA